MVIAPPGRHREQDLTVTARPLDVECRNLPVAGEPWIDVAVPSAAWPAGLGQMVDRSPTDPSGGLGAAVPRDGSPLRLWPPEGETRLILRTQQGIRADGKDVLADVTVDPTSADRGTIRIVATTPASH